LVWHRKYLAIFGLVIDKIGENIKLKGSRFMLELTES